MLSWWLPHNVSSYVGDVDYLFYLIFYITGVAWVLVQAAMLVFLFMYRHREGRRATYTHGNTTLEIMWTIVPALILVMLGFMSKATWDAIRHTHPPSTTVVQITAKQFNWEILYPGPDGKFETADDKMIENGFKATEPGVYELPCAELCGFGHSGMLGHVTVQTAEDYKAWTKEQWPS